MLHARSYATSAALLPPACRLHLSRDGRSSSPEELSARRICVAVATARTSGRGSNSRRSIGRTPSAVHSIDCKSRPKPNKKLRTENCNDDAATAVAPPQCRRASFFTTAFAAGIAAGLLLQPAAANAAELMTLLPPLATADVTSAATRVAESAQAVISRAAASVPIDVQGVPAAVAAWGGEVVQEVTGRVGQTADSLPQVPIDVQGVPAAVAAWGGEVAQEVSAQFGQSLNALPEVPTLWSGNSVESTFGAVFQSVHTPTNGEVTSAVGSVVAFVTSPVVSTWQSMQLTEGDGVQSAFFYGALGVLVLGLVNQPRE